MAKKVVEKKKKTVTVPTYESKPFVPTEADKWIIKHQSNVQYTREFDKKGEVVGWIVEDKKSNKVIAKGKTLDECFLNASKKDGWK